MTEEIKKEYDIKVAENKDGTKTILVDGVFYVPVEKKDVTIDRLKPTRKKLDDVGEVLVANKNRLDRCAKEMDAILTAQRELNDNIIKIARTLGQLDQSYRHQ
tara:strand:+ start:2492 stop:2800 length:309 start_codon:yes stop_codon:yes gene_type:complete